MYGRTACRLQYAGIVTVYADLFRYRELFRNLFQRDLRVKYRGSVLGLAWSLMNPLALMGIYFLVFAVLWTSSGQPPHYPLYLLTGISIWIFFGVSLQTAATSMHTWSGLIRKVKFPRQLVAFSAIATQLVTFGVMLAILIVFSLVSVPEARGTVWLAIPLAAVFAALVFGVGLLVASLNVLFRDIEHILEAALLPWFFLTPILYQFETTKGFQEHHTLVEILRWGNFVTPPIYALRSVIWGGRVPAAADLIYLVAAAALALGLGAFVFSRIDDRIAVEL
jgi:ABC-type polysaccharide/polyol phosphate export permease